jgi:hypothetical protein
MTLQKKYLIGFILIVAIGVAVMIADDAGGSIAMSSRDGWEGPAHFRTDIKCDSATQYYVWPDTAGHYVTNIHCTVRLYPWVQDSTNLDGTGVSLDSIGKYLVVTRFYPKGVGTPLWDSTFQDHEGPTHNIPTPPAGSHLCNVWGYVWGPQENPKQYARLTFTISEDAQNSCEDVIMAFGPVSVETNVYGGFSKDLIQNTCLLNPETGNPTEWRVEVTWQDQSGVGRSKTKSFAIPADSTTYNLVF